MNHTIKVNLWIGDIVYHIGQHREPYKNEIMLIQISDRGIRYIGDNHDFDESETIYKTKNEAIHEIIKEISKDLDEK